MAARWSRVLAIAVLVVTGCSVPRAVVEPHGGRLEVLRPTPGFSNGSLPAGWLIEGTIGAPEQISTIVKDGVPALRLASGGSGFVLARHTQAKLLATPYLSWAWNMDPHAGESHPVGLVVGFYGGNPRRRSWGSEPLRWLGSTLPPYDRRLAIVWRDSALKRGSWEDRGREESGQPRYTQRGGRENTGSWWLETADLTDLYRRLWPDDDQGRVEIVFIGFSVASGETAAGAHLSGVLLSR